MWALLVVLAGCRVDATVNIDVAANGSGRVVVTVQADHDVIQKSPQLLSGLRFEDARAAGWTVDGPSAPTDKGSQVQLTKTFRTIEEGNLALQEVSGPQGPLSSLVLQQTRTFAKTTTQLAGPVRVTDITDFADAEVVTLLGGVAELRNATRSEPLKDHFGLAISAVLPGDIESDPINVPVGTTSTVQFFDVQIDSGAQRARLFSRIALGIAGGCAVVAIGLALLRRPALKE